MKKIAFIITLALVGTVAVNANHTVNPVVVSADQVLYCKVTNNTAAAFEYKVGSDVFTVAAGETAGFAFEENTQILKKDSNGNWINWFIFDASYSFQNVQLSDIINLSNH